ncbi:unnamed protein product, partial [Prorocentrum cordatum]
MKPPARVHRPFEEGAPCCTAQQQLLALALYLGVCVQLAQRVCMQQVLLGSGGAAAEFGWSNQETGLVLSGFFYGYSLGQIPGGWAAARWGGRAPMFLLAAATASSALVPLLAVQGVAAVVAQRVVFGLLQSPMWPCTVGLVSRWARPRERSRALAWCGTSFAVGMAGGYPLTGCIMEACGWRRVFFVYGAAGLLWVPLWHRFGWSTPSGHPRITAAELSSIRQAQADDGTPIGASAFPSRVPWRAIFATRGVLAVFGVTVTNAFGMGVFVVFAPMYMHQQLGFHQERAGLLLSLPVLVSMAASLVAAPIADSMVARRVSRTRVRKAFALASCSGTALCALMLAAEPGVAVAVAAIVGAQASHGLLVCGPPVAVLEMTPEYSSVVIGLDNCLWALFTGLSGTLGGVLLDWGGCPKEGGARPGPSPTSCLTVPLRPAGAASGTRAPPRLARRLAAARGGWASAWRARASSPAAWPTPCWAARRSCAWATATAVAASRHGPAARRLGWGCCSARTPRATRPAARPAPSRVFRAARGRTSRATRPAAGPAPSR